MPASKKKVVPDPLFLQRLKSKPKRKKASFKFPHLVGFAPDEFQASNSHQDPPPRGFASFQQQKAKKREVDFKLPPLAGYAPEDLQKPTKKNSHQDPSL